LPEPSIAYFQVAGRCRKPAAMHLLRPLLGGDPAVALEGVGEGRRQPGRCGIPVQTPAQPGCLDVRQFRPGVQNWAKHFGADAISIVAYNQVVATKLDMFRTFRRAVLGWPQPPTPKVTSANVSPGTADIEVIRSIAALERMRVGRAVSKPLRRRARGQVYAAQEMSWSHRPSPLRWSRIRHTCSSTRRPRH